MPKSEKTFSTSRPKITQTKTSTSNPKYDLNYEKETNATVVGVGVMLLVFVQVIFSPFTFYDEASYNQFRIIAVIVDLICRTIVTVWVVKIAKRQNRNHTGWGWFAFFIPNLALVIIGQLKKLRLKIEVDTSLPKSEQVSLLADKANKFYEEKRYYEVVRLINKAFEIGGKNHEQLLLRAKSLYKNKEYQKAKQDLQILFDKDLFIKETCLYLGLVESQLLNLDKAIEYWKIAKENGNTQAQGYLDRYTTYKGKYLLDKKEINKKIGQEILMHESVDSQLCVTYKNGLKQADELLQKKHSTKIVPHENGFCFNLSRHFSSHDFAFSYFEIEDITIGTAHVDFVLSNGDVLSFDYDRKKDDFGMMEYILNAWKEVGF